ncbi:EpsI family protein [Desulfuromonas soudanensis]|uniref:EpsI family protein n=1 Tax=Desulfuromonas soudanensis TaxID=1603606 RepID=A0A0M3QFV1_9BACT|nr:exosortase C-terminal domain/associated protein EpsI [Desulfuromonas soudanensis]ALC16869.1 EpsI family protein [Desulfuromonas soudanensis]
MPKTPFYFSLTILLLTLGLVHEVGSRGVPAVLQTNLENLPMQIAGYEGREDTFPQGVYDALPADLHLYRHYRSPQGSELSLYIGYYGTAKGGRSSHNPYACLPGAGWGIVESGTVEVHHVSVPQGVKVNYVVASKDGVNNVMLHWYQTAGTRVLATGFQQNIERFRGRILHNRNDGAYVQVNSLAPNKGISEVREEITKFVRKLIELLPDYWPLEG